MIVKLPGDLSAVSYLQLLGAQLGHFCCNVLAWKTRWVVYSSWAASVVSLGQCWCCP
jgi:hypothetical protein